MVKCKIFKKHNPKVAISLKRIIKNTRVANMTVGYIILSDFIHYDYFLATSYRLAIDKLTL